MKRGGALGLALGGGLALALASWWLAEPEGTREARFALSPQECNTECQSQQADCIEACEGKVPCEKGCVEKCKACVWRCTHGPDAGTAGGGGSGGAAAGTGGAPAGTGGAAAGRSGSPP